MFDQLEPKRPRRARITLRALVSLAAGFILTFLLEAGLAALWPYLRDSHYQPYRLAVLLATLLNLPAVIYCRLFSMPSSLPRSDEGLHCWAIGFFLNIPYYALVVFSVWSLTRWLLNRRRPRQS